MKKIFFVLIIGSLLFAKDVIQDKGACQINWTKSFVICKGESDEGERKYNAIRAAEVIAQRNMLEFIKGVRIDSDTTIKDGMVQSDVIKTTVEGVIRGARIISRVYDKKKYAVVKIKISLYKDLIKALLNANISTNNKVKSFLNKILSVFFLYANEYSYDEKNTLLKLLQDFKKTNNKDAVSYIKKIINDIDRGYTGIIVDASNVAKFKLALVPRIRLNDGEEVYPKNFINDDILITKGPVIYETGLKYALHNKRVTSNPAILKAIGIYGRKFSDLVLDKNSQKILNKIDKRILKDAKVLILVGEK
jgi:hypothetical protein